jgi:serine/threonine protein kinase
VDPSGKVTVIDFGLSFDSYFYQIPTGFRGTLRYAAPEILNGGKTTTKVDAWGLGVIFAELV